MMRCDAMLFYAIPFCSTARFLPDILHTALSSAEKGNLLQRACAQVIASSAPGPVILKLVGLLGQMLQTEVEAEIAAVNAALSAALEKDVKATMAGLLEQMGTDASLRAKAVTFIESSVLPRASQLLNESEETQNLIADNLKKVSARWCERCIVTLHLVH
jgi:hypothetical protein